MRMDDGGEKVVVLVFAGEDEEEEGEEENPISRSRKDNNKRRFRERLGFESRVATVGRVLVRPCFQVWGWKTPLTAKHKHKSQSGYAS